MRLLDFGGVCLLNGHELTEREYWARRAAEVGEAAGRELSLRDYMRMLHGLLPSHQQLSGPQIR